MCLQISQSSLPSAIASDTKAARRRWSAVGVRLFGLGLGLFGPAPGVIVPAATSGAGDGELLLLLLLRLRLGSRDRQLTSGEKSVRDYGDG